jgi:hypothetical protein
MRNEKWERVEEREGGAAGREERGDEITKKVEDKGRKVIRTAF